MKDVSLIRSRLIYFVFGLVLFISFVVDLMNFFPSGAVDFRNRITGARLFTAQIDPYRYKWHTGQPPEYCDPYNNPAEPISNVTATPSVLLLNVPLALFPYQGAQLIWLLWQWLLLLGTTWLWWRLLEAQRRGLSHGLLLFVAGLTFTAAWRLHAERGQIYVFTLFVFALWLTLTLTLEARSPRHFFAGVVAGLLITFRPTFLLLAPFLLLHRRAQGPGVALGLLLGFALPTLVFPASWFDYFAAMQLQAQQYLAGPRPPFQAQAYPAIIEGIPLDQLAHYDVIPYADFSLYATLRNLGLDALTTWPWLELLVALFAGWLWFSRREGLAKLAPALVAWFFLIDLAIPAYRNSYGDVLALNLVATGLFYYQRFFWSLGLFLAALPIGFLVYALTWDDITLINLPALLLTLGAVGLIVETYWVAKRVGLEKRKPKK